MNPADEVVLPGRAVVAWRGVRERSFGLSPDDVRVERRGYWL
jgi:hypothetical protein